MVSTSGSEAIRAAHIKSPADRSEVSVSENHWAVLALARFFLALVVAFSHYRWFVPTYDNRISHVFAPFGPLAAVFGFLVISGFSIGHSIENQRGFYGRRIARVWPTLLSATALYTVVALQPHQPHGKWWLIIPQVLCLNGFVAPWLMAVTWSLSVEVFFYLAAPIFRSAAIWIIAVGIIISGASYCLIDQLKIGTFEKLPYGLTAICCFWAWASGFLAYRFRNITAASLLPLVIGIVLFRLHSPEGATLWAVTWCLTGAAIAGGRLIALGSLTRQIFNYLGNVSYPLYLLHVIVYAQLKGLGVFGWPIAAGAAFATAILCYHVVDAPLRRRLAAASVFQLDIERLAPLLVTGVIAATVAAAFIGPSWASAQQ